MPALNLGLIADSSIQLTNLEAIVESAGYQAVVSVLSRSDSFNSLPNVDLWVVRIDVQDARSQHIVEALDALDVPTIYDDASVYSSLNIEEKAKRFSKKIEACVKKRMDAPLNFAKAQQVWVLAASAGGPEAVIKFASLLPDNLNGVALIYAQHIDGAQVKNLGLSLGRKTCWNIRFCDESQPLLEKSIYVLSPCTQISFDDLGFLTPLDSAWAGQYQPSIDQVLAKVASKYGKQCGAIVFSGMGDDGSKTCRLVTHAGGEVWVQSPESCAIDSMPSEVLETQCVSYSGTPEQLAQHFIQRHLSS